MDKVTELHEQSKRLDELSKRVANPTAVQLDVLYSIISDLDSSPKVRAIFGEKPLSLLGAVAVSNDLRIVDLDRLELTDRQKKDFLEELNRIIDSHTVRK